MRTVLLVTLLLTACDRSEPAADIVARFAALTPQCSAPAPYTPRAPLKIGVAQLPLDDASIRETITCTGHDVRLVVSRDEHQTTRAVEITFLANTSAEVRPRIEPAITGLVPPDAVRHILDDLEEVITEPHRVGDVKVKSRQDIPPPPGLPLRREFTVEIRWP